MQPPDKETRKISIVVPAYNEADVLEESYKKIKKYLEEKNIDHEIIIVEDGSRDNTREIAEAISESDPKVKLLVNEVNKGKGFTVKKGMLYASGDPILYTDADLSTPIDELNKLMNALDEGFDVVIGSRALEGSDVRIRQPFYREYSGRIFNVLMKAITFLDIKDTQCGFKLFKAKAASDLFSRQTIDGFSFDVEDLYIAKKLGYRIKEVPVTWINSETSTVNLIKHSIQMFIDLLKIRINDLSSRYRR